MSDIAQGVAERIEHFAALWLQVFDGEREILAAPVQGAHLSVGRADTCDLLLPSDTVSRLHFTLQARAEGWIVTDHSSHGTSLDGERVTQARIRPGQTLSFGRYQAKVLAQPPHAGATQTRALASSDFEQLADATSGTAMRAQVRVVSGPRTGLRVVLHKHKTKLGGVGADLQIDPELPADAAVLHVAYGRVSAQEGSRPLWAGDQRLRLQTPVFEGEHLRVGENTFVVEGVLMEADEAALTEFGDLIGASPTMRSVFAALSRVARHDTPVLLLGETGTGKELAARAIHESSPRAEGPWVALNCGAIPENLIESELFGYEAGAFTGATRQSDGAFQRAHTGTLFLDEVGELSANAQKALLRVLETGEVRRIGGAQVQVPDVRIVAATHRDLVAEVQEGRFRADLLWRLAVLPLVLPPLRERLEDVGAIARHLLQTRHPGAFVTPDGLTVLQSHDWPGNVRELRNVLTRAFVLHGPQIGPSQIEIHPDAFRRAAPHTLSVDDVEKARLLEALRLSNFNKSQAARRLGIARTTLLYKLQRCGISDQDLAAAR